jgi:threonine dehydratase
MDIVTFNDILQAKNRISEYVNQTRIISDPSLNNKLRNNIFFKLENLQKSGSFKVRGAFNHLLYLKENNKLPKKVVVVTSGNHGIATAYICNKLGIELLIYTSKITSKYKIETMTRFGANVIVTDKRSQANILAESKIKDDYHFIHPSSDDLVIAGQGTVLLESIQQECEFDSVFAACGGGGLVSGIYLASQGCVKKPRVFAVEPQNANDAWLSVQNNEIFSFKDSPNTIADGARTLSVSPKIFQYLKRIDDIITVSENDILSWSQDLNKILKMNIEPTAAMAMAGCCKWIEKNDIKGENILVILSGGNCQDL